MFSRLSHAIQTFSFSCSSRKLIVFKARWATTRACSIKKKTKKKTIKLTASYFKYYLKKIIGKMDVLIAFSISAFSRWKAMYCTHRMELLGEPTTIRSKSSAVTGGWSESINFSSVRDSFSSSKRACSISNSHQINPRLNVN